MGFLPVPQPYDFDVSLDRFTFWGVDRANVWADGALYRVVAGREVRMTPSPGGVQVDGVAVAGSHGSTYRVSVGGEFCSNSRTSTWLRRALLPPST